MNSKVIIVVDSLFPKRHLEKTFEYSVNRRKGSVLGGIVFDWKGIEHYGNMKTFHYDKVCFVQKLFDYYCGSLKGC